MGRGRRRWRLRRRAVKCITCRNWARLYRIARRRITKPTTTTAQSIATRRCQRPQLTFTIRLRLRKVWADNLPNRRPFAISPRRTIRSLTFWIWAWRNKWQRHQQPYLIVHDRCWCLRPRRGNADATWSDSQVSDGANRLRTDNINWNVRMNQSFRKRNEDGWGGKSYICITNVLFAIFRYV